MVAPREDHEEPLQRIFLNILKILKTIKYNIQKQPKPHSKIKMHFEKIQGGSQRGSFCKKKLSSKKNQKPFEKKKSIKFLQEYFREFLQQLLW